MAAYENGDQARVDEAVTALAWSIYKPEHARMLAELAVEDTGLGDVESKVDQEHPQDLRHPARHDAGQKLSASLRNCRSAAW